MLAGVLTSSNKDMYVCVYMYAIGHGVANSLAHKKKLAIIIDYCGASNMMEF